MTQRHAPDDAKGIHAPDNTPDMPQMMPQYHIPLSIIFDILKVPDFIAHDESFQHCTWLYLTVPGCTWLCLGLP